MSEAGKQHIIISRIDSIGDVVLTLPMAGFLKKHLGDCRISFLGRAYTRDVIEGCQHVDQFLNWDEISSLADQNADAILHVFPNSAVAKMAKRSGIRIRVGSSRRLIHWFTCNKRVWVKRHNSPLHEAQLNFQLLKGLNINVQPSLEEISRLFGLTKIPAAPEWLRPVEGKFNLILHPRSKGSAREWGPQNFASLMQKLPSEKFKVFLTGTKAEWESMKAGFPTDGYENLCGKLSLAELIGFIDQVDGLVAASTGPLHLASALGKHAIGLYAPMTSIHPRRWGPVGKKGKAFVVEKKCIDCKRTGTCHCIAEIAPHEVSNYLLSLATS